MLRSARAAHAPEQLQYFFSQCDGALPGSVEGGGAAGAVEQGHAEGVFEVFDLRTHRRLRQPDLTSGRRKGASPRDADKGFQLSDHRQVLGWEFESGRAHRQPAGSG
ncbi:hypothetical protein AO263_14490 [Pseudomonas sp. NZIPFR-PS5]|nr:hypothetical protein AO263_14490 [Pseudomonas sp. NZIPFR-PS5]